MTHGGMYKALCPSCKYLAYVTCRSSKGKQIEIRINKLKEKMYKSAAEKGFSHKDTVRISEELDQLILLTI